MNEGLEAGGWRNGNDNGKNDAGQTGKGSDMGTMRLHLMLWLSVACSAIGCSQEQQFRSMGFVPFVPVDVDAHMKLVECPEYWDDVDLRTGLPIVLTQYGHAFVSVNGKVWVRANMHEENLGPESRTEIRNLEPSAERMNMEYRWNMTSKAFGAGGDYVAGEAYRRAAAVRSATATSGKSTE